MSVLTNNQEIEEFCIRLSKESFIAVDTEFMRENTYWPKLCLIQLASHKEAKIIDPLIEKVDLKPVDNLMLNQQITKVFHSGRQDIEIFYNRNKKVPYPVFDTQVAGMVCGFGHSASYDSMVSTLLKMKIDKVSRFTDWSLRPLSDKQISYALNDVKYLIDIYHILLDDLNKKNRSDWIIDEINKLIDENNYHIDPKESWKKIKTKNHSKKLIPIIYELSYWREIEAQRLDIPRNRLLRDEAIIEIASSKPKSENQLSRIRGISKSFSLSKKGSEIISLVKKTKEFRDIPAINLEMKKKEKRNNDPIIDLLKILLNIQSKKHEVSANLISSVYDLHRIINEDKPDVQALKGWRYKIFGKHALNIKEGKIIVKVINGKIKFIKN